jgi:Uma2 family endonuclease
MATVSAPLLTAEDLLAMPDDGMERELIDGQLRERPMTMRNCPHSWIEACIAKILGNWLDAQPEPRGGIVSGEAGFRLRRSPDTFVGIDIACVSAELFAATPPDAKFFDGPPVLAVEILSPSDSVANINEKIDLYFDSGVLLVWVIDPHRRTVMSFRPEAEPELFTTSQEITAEPHLPGFRADVKRFFAK